VLLCCVNRIGERAHVLYEAERTKIALSHHESYRVIIPVDTRILDITITRTQVHLPTLYHTIHVHACCYHCFGDNV
jgi:hypothetical protein